MRSPLLRTLMLIIALPLAAAETVSHAQPRVGKADAFEGLVDVGGYKLYARCAGGGAGPTVVLEAGASSPSSDWDRVAPEVSRFARVCRYDRANVGKSGAAPKPRAGAQLIEDLRALLAKSGERAPYVFVGHSFGGLLGVLYAAKYPKEVAGLVLVDSSHEDQRTRFEALMTPQQLAESRARLASLPEGVDMAAVRAEVAASRWRADIPLAVLVHGVVDKGMIPPGWTEEQLAARERVWLEMQRDFARRSPRGEMVVAERSGHYVQNDQPELVIDAVRRVVEAVRKGRAAGARRE